MQNLKIEQDIRPLSEVRKGMANFIKQVRDNNDAIINRPPRNPDVKRTDHMAVYQPVSRRYK